MMLSMRLQQFSRKKQQQQHVNKMAITIFESLFVLFLVSHFRVSKDVISTTASAFCLVQQQAQQYQQYIFNEKKSFANKSSGDIRRNYYPIVFGYNRRSNRLQSILLKAMIDDNESSMIRQQMTPTTQLDDTNEQMRKLQETYNKNSATKTKLSSNTVMDKMYQSYLIQSATSLKQQLKQRQLDIRGRKPDLARRLLDNDIEQLQKLTISSTTTDDNNIPYNTDDTLIINRNDDTIPIKNVADSASSSSVLSPISVLTHFAGIELSETASIVLSRAKFVQPTIIQQLAIFRITKSTSFSCLLHAETGSGKTLAYLLPITEKLWRIVGQQKQQQQARSNDSNEKHTIALIITPTQELASQVASAATVLAPPGTVRLITTPTNLMIVKDKERGEYSNGGYISDQTNKNNNNYNGIGIGSNRPTLYIGSAKTIHTSLYGNSKIPAPPTPKPQAMEFLKSVQYIVLDEVDRLLFGPTGYSSSSSSSSGTTSPKKNTNPSQQHEKPAAVVVAAVTRLTYGAVQIIAASATVGRPLTREFARVLGLPPKECPLTIRAIETTAASSVIQDDDVSTTTRAITLPKTVTNYVVPVQYIIDPTGADSSSSSVASPGKLLTTSYQVIKSLHSKNNKLKILLVLTRNFGISITNVIGALKHFHCQPVPQSLSDALDSGIRTSGAGSDHLISNHQQVTRTTGIGESLSDNNNNKNDSNGGYLLVTGEESVRGLHLSDLDIVLIAGRPAGVDEYVHIAGRTGRAGKSGIAITVYSEPILSNDDSSNPDGSSGTFVASWERMLQTKFIRISNPNDVCTVVNV